MAGNLFPFIQGVQTLNITVQLIIPVEGIEITIGRIVYFLQSRNNRKSSIDSITDLSSPGYATTHILLSHLIMYNALATVNQPVIDCVAASSAQLILSVRITAISLQLK